MGFLAGSGKYFRAHEQLSVDVAKNPPTFETLTLWSSSEELFLFPDDPL
jgi:hypothetical protein